MIYFLQAPDGGPIKIGTTIRLTERLKQLGKETGLELRVLAVVDGGPDEEKALHRQFAPLRVVGEWFEPGDDLVGFIIESGQPWNGSDEKPAALIAVKCRSEYKDWVVKFAKYRRVTPSQLVDIALAALAEQDSFETPPER